MANKSLKGCRLLLLRQAEDSLPLKLMVEGIQGSCLNWPALSIKRLLPLTLDQEAKIKLGEMAIFVSKTSANFGFNLLAKDSTKTILAVGSGTATRLNELGATEVLFPLSENSEGLLTLKPLKQVKGKNIIIFKGENGRDVLQTTLLKKEAIVTTIDLYKRKLATISETEANAIKQFSPNMIHIASIAVAESLYQADQKFKILGEHKTIFLVVSQRIEKAAHNLGFIQTVNLNSMKNEIVLEGLMQNLPID